MFEVIKGWIHRFLSEEDAVLLAVLLIGFAIVILTMGSILAPLLTGIVLAYVMQGIIKVMERYNLPNGLAVVSTFLLFLGGFVGLLFFVIPRVWRQMRNLFTELPDMVSQTQIMLQDLPNEYPTLISENQMKSWGEMLSAEAGDIGQWLLSFSISQLPVLVAGGGFLGFFSRLAVFLFFVERFNLFWC